MGLRRAYITGYSPDAIALYGSLGAEDLPVIPPPSSRMIPTPCLPSSVKRRMDLNSLRLNWQDCSSSLRLVGSYQKLMDLAQVPLSAQCIVDFCTSLRYTIITA